MTNKQPNRFYKFISSLFLGLFLIGGLALLFGVLTPPALAVSCSVPSGGYPTIQAAINDPTCDTIVLSAQPYNENLTITRSLSLQGAGPAATIINGDNTTTVISISGSIASVQISALKVMGGDATGASGGGIRAVVDGAAAQLSLNNVQVSENAAGVSGGGLYAEISNGAAMVISRTAFLSNTTNGAGAGGAVVFSSGGVLTVTNSTLINNAAQTNGGGLALEGDGQGFILNTIFGRNSADTNGAGMYINGITGTQIAVAHVTLADPAPLGNLKQAIYATGTGGTVGIGNSLIANHNVGVQQDGGVVVSQDYNMFYNITSGSNAPGTIGGGSSFTSVTQPFVNAAADDYHLRSVAEAIDAGLNTFQGLTLTYDIDDDTRPQGSTVDIGADEATAELAISKSAVVADTVVTYTLTVTNTGLYPARNVVITDTVPSGATHLSGGTLTGTVVSLPVSDLAAGGGTASASFSVEAPQTITNDDYGVRADTNLTTIGTIPVTTEIFQKVYLPIVLKP